MTKKIAVLLLGLLVGCPAILLPVVSGEVTTIPTTAPVVSGEVTTIPTTAPVVSGEVTTIPATAPATSDAVPTRLLDYRVSLAPSQIWDGTIEYFKARNFTTVVLVAAEPVPYDKELQKIKQMGLYPILDIEVVIWNGGANKSTPIAQFDGAFSTWKEAGWTNVATEGGRSGDFDILKNYFPKITFFNCDRCGLWKDGYRNSYTTEMSWETYFPSEISSIQRGALISYNLGKPQGITAGVWENNNENRNYDVYKALLDWSYANEVGFTHFNVFFGLGATLADYQRLGFDAIISQLQQDYPPKPTGFWPSITITSVRQVPTPQNSIVWDIANLGNEEVWVAPYAVLHNGTATLDGRVTGEGTLSQGVYNSSSTAAPQSDSYNWTHLGAGEEISVLSPPTVPADTKWAAYNAYIYYNNSSHGWLYDQPLYTTVGVKPVPANFLDFLELFDYSKTDLALLLLLVLAVPFTVALLLRLRRMRQK